MGKVEPCVGVCGVLARSSSMPELAEVHQFAATVNRHSEHVYVKVTKAEVHKLENNFPRWSKFKLRARARGKEAILSITRLDGKKQKEPEERHYLFRFGMSGSFRYFGPGEELHKHAHVVFEDETGKHRVAFVDQRRFGRWEEVESDEDWGEERGPDPVYEYAAFCANVAATVVEGSKYWNRPICEVLLKQEVFNGIGNYLRAEILHDAGVADPFRHTGKVLADLSPANCEENRLLQLCRDVPLKFMGSPKYGKQLSTDEVLMKVYGRKDSLSRKDSNGRMVWWRQSVSSTEYVAEEEEEEEENKTKKKKKVKKRHREVQSHEEKLEVIDRRSSRTRVKLQRTDTVVLEEWDEDEDEGEGSRRAQRKAAKKVSARKKAKSQKKTQRRRKNK